MALPSEEGLSEKASLLRTCLLCGKGNLKMVEKIGGLETPTT